MIKEILQLGNKVLETKSKEVKEPKSAEVKNLINDLIETLNSDPDRTAGISAPQVGILQRVIICRRVDKEKQLESDEPIWEPMINPKIVSKSAKKSTYWEGCLSIKDGNLFGEVERPERVTVEYTTPEGEEKSLKAKGYFSHVVQHEVDHINGVLFISYIKDPTKLYTSAQLDEILDDSETEEE